MTSRRWRAAVVTLGSLAATDRSWTEAAVVRLAGALLGIALLVAAVRALFGRGRR